MEKRIKFRAKVIMSGKNVQFYQGEQYLNSFLRRITIFLPKVNKSRDGAETHESYLSEPLENCLERWTGLKDNLGKDIYEGDIVISNDGQKDYIHVVYITIHGVRFGSYYLHDTTFKGGWKVIGNTWENPNLVK